MEADRGRPARLSRGLKWRLTTFCASTAVPIARVIRSVSLSPADIHDQHMAEELLEDTEGWALGDRTYQSPKLSERLSGEAVRPAYTMVIESTPA